MQTRHFLVCILWGLLANHAVGDGPTLPEIVSGLEQAEAQIWKSNSLLIQYERYDTRNVINNVASGGYLLTEWTLAYRGDMWLVKRRYTQPRGTGKKGDPFVQSQPMTQIVRGGILLEWEGKGSAAMIDKFKTGRNIFGGLVYPRHLSTDVAKYIVGAAADADSMDTIRKRQSGELNHPFLPEFLKSNIGQYHVATDETNIDGRQCWRVEWPGMDELWVDVGRGYTIPRRVYCWGPGKPRKFEYVNSDYREVKPGVWMPYRQTELRYASIVAESESIWDKVTSQSEFRVNEVIIDAVPESIFDVALPKGTEVIDGIRDFRYTVTEDSTGDPLTAPISEGLEMLRRGAGRKWLLYASVLVVVAVLALIFVRIVRQRRTLG